MYRVYRSTKTGEYAHVKIGYLYGYIIYTLYYFLFIEPIIGTELN